MIPAETKWSTSRSKRARQTASAGPGEAGRRSEVTLSFRTDTAHGEREWDQSPIDARQKAVIAPCRDLWPSASVIASASDSQSPVLAVPMWLPPGHDGAWQ